MAQERDPLESRDFGWMVAMSFVFFALVTLAYFKELGTDYGKYQRQFPKLLAAHGKGEEARAFSPGIRQLWIPKINVTDRCITCHLGYEYSSALPASVPEPLTPHPMPAWMPKHELGSYGCTPCHGGDGWATTLTGAHIGGKGWEDPMLSIALAKSVGLTRGEMMEMRCNFCHRHDAATPGMDVINQAKVLFKKKKCLVCHVVEGRGGTAGPELTYEGDKNPELVDFSHIAGPRTFFNWNMQHLKVAGAVTPNTKMPDFNLPDDEARALTLLVLSWRRLSFPPEYIPEPAVAEAWMKSFPTPTPTATPEPAAAASPAAAPPPAH